MPSHTGPCPPGFKRVRGECVRDETYKSEHDRDPLQGLHAHPHEPNGAHDHPGLPDTTGGHAHTPETLGAHKHRPGDPLEGWHLNIGTGFHVHNSAQGISQSPSREEVVNAHFPAPQWIPDAVKTQVRVPGGEWRDSTRNDWEEHAMVPMHNPEMSIEEHLEIFVGPDRLLEMRYFLKDGAIFSPGPKEYEAERKFLSRMIQKSITEHSRVKVLHRPIGYGYKLDGEILFTLLEPVEGKSEGIVVVLEKQRAPGTAMKNAPKGAIDAATVEVLDVSAKSAEEVAKEFIGRRIFILEKVGNKLREKDILLGLLDFDKSEPKEWTVKHLIEKQTSVQSVILSKERFTTVGQAREWIRELGFKDDKVDEKPETFRFRQFPPDQCKSGTLRTIQITRGVSAVICVPQGSETPTGGTFSESPAKDMTKSEALRFWIPNQFRYWQAGTTAQAITVADALLEAISDGTINLSKEKS